MNNDGLVVLKQIDNTITFPSCMCNVIWSNYLNMILPRSNYVCCYTYNWACLIAYRAYYSSNGSRYSLGRIPIAGTDFSTRPYTYDDVADDLSLQNFSLAQEDYDYKIPYLRKAIELNPDVKFFSAAWSAPPWMKTNDRINGFGKCDNTISTRRKNWRKMIEKCILFIWKRTVSNNSLNVSRNVL